MELHSGGGHATLHHVSRGLLNCRTACRHTMQQLTHRGAVQLPLSCNHLHLCVRAYSMFTRAVLAAGPL